MCGLAGVIFGQGDRSADELRHLTQIFTRLLVISRQRGPHATGIAWLNRDGEHRLFKRPVPAARFTEHKAYGLVLAGVDQRTTALLGHTRWGTRGSEQVNANNHPIRAGHVIGTHNGTVYNADELFERYRLPRHAEVDSEILFRLADTAITKPGDIDRRRYATRLRHCWGQITAVMASRRAPETVLLLKGNNPLELQWHPRLNVVIYASSMAYLDTVLTGKKGWRRLGVPAMTLLTFRTADLSAPSSMAIRFVATSPTRSRLDALRQPEFDDF